MATPTYTDESVTYQSFEVYVTGLQKNDLVRFWLYYADSSWNTTKAIIDDQQKTATSSADIRFSASGLTANSRLIYNCSVTRSGDANSPYTLGRVKTWTEETPLPPRPNNWYWLGITQGNYATNLTATQWNNFTTRINDFRAHLGLENYYFPYVGKGDTFTASHYNDAVRAINGMGRSTLPTVSKGATLKASLLQDLAVELNSY